MGYEILSNDLLHTNDKPDKKRPGFLKRILRKINPFHIHLGLIIILGLSIFLVFMSDFNFDFGFNFQDNETGVLTLSGEFASFSQNYTGNLSVYSSKFTIETQTGKFDGESKTIFLENFSGYIKQTNKSLIFDGTSNKIEFGNNHINTNDGRMKIISTGKTQTDLLLEKVYFPNLDGNAKLDSTLNYGFDNSSINITKFKVKMTYDGSYTFSGKAEKFAISSNNHNLKIIYNRNLNK